MHQMASMDLQGILKSVLSGDDTISWIESYRMSSDELLTQLIEILYLAEVILNEDEITRFYKLIENQDSAFMKINHQVRSLANNGLIPLGKSLSKRILFENKCVRGDFSFAIGTLVIDDEKFRVQRETSKVTQISNSFFHYGFMHPKFIHTIRKHLRSIISDEMIRIYTSSGYDDSRSIIWKIKPSK